jgi:hypothetical protein
MKRIFVTCCLMFLLGTFAQSAAAQSWSPNGPLPREFHSAVFDTSTKRMIVFGGFPLDTNSTQNLNDVWRLTASSSALGGSSLNWSLVHATGTPPAPRFGHSAGYDPGSNRMMVFGGAEGRSSPCANDVWVLTNANGIGGASAWMQLNPAGGPPAARYAQGGVYDPTSNTLMIYGGNNCFSTTFSDFWVLSNANGVGGTPTWTQLSPSGGPGPRQVSRSVVYDPTSNEFILFGGASGSGTDFNDVWVLSNANGSGGTPTWTQLSPTGTFPAVRNLNSATYDPTTDRMTIFGGGNNVAGSFGDTWVLTDANGLGGTPAWMQIASSSVDFPAPRSGHTAVYDPVTNVMTIFSGYIGLASPYSANDVFLLSDANGR